MNGIHWIHIYKLLRFFGWVHQGPGGLSFWMRHSTHFWDTVAWFGHCLKKAACLLHKNEAYKEGLSQKPQKEGNRLNFYSLCGASTFPDERKAFLCLHTISWKTLFVHLELSMLKKLWTQLNDKNLEQKKWKHALKNSAFLCLSECSPDYYALSRT